MRKKIVLGCVLLLVCLLADAQKIVIKGVVTDSISGEALPYASLMLKGTTIGTITDADGRFSLSTSSAVRVLEVSYLGYDVKTVDISSGKTTNLKIRLAPTGITLNEIVVEPGRERYRRKDNPAVRFVREVIARRDGNDPRNHDYFRYDQYEKVVFAMNDYTPKKKKNGQK